MEIGTVIYDLVTAPLGVFLLGFIFGVVCGDRFEPFERVGAWFTLAATKLKEFGTKFVSFFKRG